MGRLIWQSVEQNYRSLRMEGHTYIKSVHGPIGADLERAKRNSQL